MGESACWLQHRTEAVIYTFRMYAMWHLRRSHEHIHPEKDHGRNGLGTYPYIGIRYS